MLRGWRLIEQHALLITTAIAMLGIPGAIAGYIAQYRSYYFHEAITEDRGIWGTVDNSIQRLMHGDSGRFGVPVTVAMRVVGPAQIGNWQLDAIDLIEPRHVRETTEYRICGLTEFSRSSPAFAHFRVQVMFSDSDHAVVTITKCDRLHRTFSASGGLEISMYRSDNNHWEVAREAVFDN